MEMILVEVSIYVLYLFCYHTIFFRDRIPCIVCSERQYDFVIDIPDLWMMIVFLCDDRYLS